MIKLPKMNRSLIMKTGVVLAVCAGIVFLIVIGRLFIPKEEEMLAPPLRAPEKVQYKTWEAVNSSIYNTITCRGYFSYEKQMDLSFSNRDGYMKAIYVAAGDAVVKGQMLALLDSEMIESDLKQQKIILDTARKMIANLQEKASLNISISEMEYAEFKKDLEAKRLLKDTIPRAELDKLENQLLIRQNSLEMLKNDYQTRLLEAEQHIQLTGLKIGQLEHEILKATMRAPMAGIIEYVSYIHEGEYVPAYKKIVTIADPRSMVLQYKGDHFAKFHLGMKVAVDVDDQEYKGEVVLVPQVVPAEDYERMKDTIQVRLNKLPAAVERGDTGVIKVTLDWAENVLVLPKRLVHKYSGRWFVKTLENGIVNERDVQVGIESATEYEIRGGLDEGELVVE
ncbi:MAG: HlyD family efflux transporter periplasmic adaptor subunit [Spirochaetales bacterium]|nr:HlyD family efflux transporter periplasmic adaptor subunit [Spirochaetales bacterium]